MIEIIFIVLSLFVFYSTLVVFSNMFWKYSSFENIKNKNLSILIPARNEEKNIKNCIDSIINTNKNFNEIIIYDDHSTDSTREEIEKCSKDVNKPIVLNKKILDIKSEKKVNKYVPLSKRQDRPEAVLWLTKNYPQLSDGQIVKLVGSTKNTVASIRNKNYWNYSNLTAKDAVVFNFCNEADIKKAVEKADRKIAKKKKEEAKKNLNIETK